MLLRVHFALTETVQLSTNVPVNATNLIKTQTLDKRHNLCNITLILKYNKVNLYTSLY